MLLIGMKKLRVTKSNSFLVKQAAAKQNMFVHHANKIKSNNLCYITPD